MKLLGENDIIKDSYLTNYAGEILVVAPRALGEKYRKPENQLFRAGGGFGCSPSAIGSCVVGTYLIDGENCRMERFDFLGVVKPEVYEAWKQEFQREEK